MKINKEIVISVVVGILIAIILLFPYWLFYRINSVQGQQGVVLQQVVGFLNQNGQQQVQPVVNSTSTK